MSALYILSGVLVGVASTAISVGVDVRIGAIFVPAFILAVISARLEYLKDGGR